MNYDVDWGPVAENMLAAIWLAAPDREAVTVASDVLDQAMADDPLTLGESRESSVRRVAFEPPLGVEFEVIEDDKRVVVQGVFRVG
jgi:hypothetical protein